MSSKSKFSEIFVEIINDIVLRYLYFNLIIEQCFSFICVILHSFLPISNFEPLCPNEAIKTLLFKEFSWPTLYKKMRLVCIKIICLTAVMMGYLILFFDLNNYVFLCKLYEMTISV